MALWQYRRYNQPNKWIEPAVIVVAVLALLSLITTGSRGGEINHPELVDQAVLDAAAGASGGGIVAAVEALTIGSQYVWPAFEAAHFLGMALLFGVLVFIAARMFGLAKSVSFAGLHRILPLAVFGFMINVITGMLLFVSNSGRYVAMTDTFYPKMGLILLGGLAVLYYTVFDRPWALKPNDEPPALSKGIAAATVLMWTFVLIYGRWLPYGAGG